MDHDSHTHSSKQVMNKTWSYRGNYSLHTGRTPKKITRYKQTTNNKINHKLNKLPPATKKINRAEAGQNRSKGHRACIIGHHSGTELAQPQPPAASRETIWSRSAESERGPRHQAAVCTSEHHRLHHRTSPSEYAKQQPSERRSASDHPWRTTRKQIGGQGTIGDG